MKVFVLVMKILVALAAVAGAIYLAATYGDRIIAWAKKALAAIKRPKAEFFDEDFCDEDCVEDDEIVAADDDFEG